MSPEMASTILKKALTDAANADPLALEKHDTGTIEQAIELVAKDAGLLAKGAKTPAFEPAVYEAAMNAAARLHADREGISLAKSHTDLGKTSGIYQGLYEGREVAIALAKVSHPY